MERKRICFITDTLFMGGVERVLADALKMLKEKYEITVVSLYGYPDSDILKMIPDGINVVIKNISLGKLQKVISDLPYLSKWFYKKVLGNKRFDYLISLKPDVLTACYYNYADCNIHWVHVDIYSKYAAKKKLSFVQKLKRLRLKIIYNKYDDVWSVVQGISDDLSSAFKINDVYTLPNPLDCDDIKNKSVEPCDTMFDPHKTNIVMLGRLSEEKGIDRVVRVFAECEKERIANAHLYIIGEGGERYKLEKMISENSLSDSITLLGQRPNPFPILKQADLFVSASTSESFGLVIMEAMLLKVPVIVTDTMGGKYVTKNGELGICVDSDQTLKTALLVFLENGYRYPCSLDAAHDWVLEHDIGRFAERIETRLNRL